jgi:integrase/recombinase XerD
MKLKPKLKDLPINPTSEKLIKDFKQYLKVSGYVTAKRVGSTVRELLWWLEKEKISLEKASRKEMQMYCYYLQNRPNYTRAGSLSMQTISGYFFIVRLFFDYLQKVGLKVENPMSVWSLDLKGGEKKERYVLTKKEIGQLYEVCKNEFEKVLLGIFYGCGLRRSEAGKLNRKDINFTLKCLYVRSGKGRKRRVVPMAENVINDVKNYLLNERNQRLNYQSNPSDKTALLLNKRGKRMSGNSLYLNFKTILLRTQINKEVSLHHLRHTIATHLLAEGMSVEEVRDFLGHECLESTQIYTRVNLQSGKNRLK